VRANDSRSSTFKLQPFPPANDEKNDITIPIHHDGNDIKQSGSLGYRGIVFNEAPKDTVYPPYKDALSCSPTSKLQPSPSTNDEEIETPTSIHHGNDKIQSGFLGYRGPVYNEAPKDTAYPSYKDVLMSQRHATERKLTTSASSRKDSSRNSAPGRSTRKRSRRKRRKKRSKMQLPEEIKAINRAVIAASRKLASEMDHYSQESMAEEWNWLGDLRQRAYESNDFQTTAFDRLILGYAMEEDNHDLEVNDDQVVVEQFEFVRSISTLIKAARTQVDQDKDESIDDPDPVPRLASVPDSATSGFRRGWTSRESKYTIGGTKTSVQ